MAYFDSVGFILKEIKNVNWENLLIKSNKKPQLKYTSTDICTL